MSGSNGVYIDEMFKAWKSNPDSVHKSWDIYFRTGQFQVPPSSQTSAPAQFELFRDNISPKNNTAKIMQMLRAHQVRGHLLADIDPLRITKHGVDQKLIAEDSLNPEHFGLSHADMEESVNITVPGVKGFQDPARGEQKLKYLLRRLKETYTGTIGVEYMHISNTEHCNFIRERLETIEHEGPNADKKLIILDRLCWADHFERFLAKKYSTAKRFGLEGAEALIPGMKALIDVAANLGMENVVMGMPHRGRLNVLASVVRKPLELIFSEFSGSGDDSEFEGSGDVKYHLGMSHDRSVYGGKKIHLSLVANPSHLEAVNPVVTGKVRAKQFFSNDVNRDKSLCLLLHGDAAFAGQGVVYETMGFTDLPDYTVGGTIHIIVNNQIGFTTDPKESRSNAYCSDIAKAFDAPIFHVNGDDIESVVKVCELAAEFRHAFKKDVVIDLVCYRKYGHNEIDEPSFTQPFMYQKISKKNSPFEVYSEKLIAEKTVSKETIDDISRRVNETLEDKFERAKAQVAKPSEWLSSEWKEMQGSQQSSAARSTGISREVFDKVGSALGHIPSDFNLHRRLQNVMQNRKNVLETGKDIDWGTGEALAFGSLLEEGIHVRLSGQDVERGTFSHRHAVLHDQKNQSTPNLIPLNTLNSSGKFKVSNSSLSEFGVLGFELGYSLESPNQLVIWEAQFGDFVNGAQVIIDQFISSGESKWLRQSGLVLLLPHGYEGQGPEHSSCRIERFLQMSSDDENEFFASSDENCNQIQKSNWQIVNCTTPANFFHVLRRQVHRSFRKPLIVATPKSLLRHKQAVSSVEDFIGDKRFQKIIPDQLDLEDDRVEKVVLCSGKVYYDLYNLREEKEMSNTAILRLEQLSPFPYETLLEQMKRYKNASRVIWCQEEPKNMGSWTYVRPRIETALKEVGQFVPEYAGRAPSASPATGFSKTHKIEQDELLSKALY